MDLNNAQYEYSSRDDNEKVEPGELLEDSWFFGNLLRRKSRMLRSLSDPCPSSNYNHHYESADKLSDEINRPTSVASSSVTTKESDLQRGKRSNRKKSSSKSLIRTPSLPTSLETEEFEDEEEIEFSMGKLIRQASMKNYSDTLPPRTQPTKGLTLTPSCSISRYTSGRNTEVESIKVEGLEEIRHQRHMNQLKTQKSLIDLESEELQGFKNLGLDFDKNHWSPNVINTIPVPGLQKKKKIQEDEEKNSGRRPHISEAWASQSYSAPPAPKWGGKRSTEDMKAQIKFWARAVASNVRQEC